MYTENWISALFVLSQFSWDALKMKILTTHQDKSDYVYLKRLCYGEKNI